MAQNEIGIYLSKELGGFVAGTKKADGTLSKNSHIINEDEIISMFSIIMRTYVAKTGNDTLVVQGADGKAVLAKLVAISALENGGGEKKEVKPKGGKGRKKKA